MHIAFYAPLKPPTHPTPSGDRRMARLLIRAWEISGHRVELASRFRAYDRGDEHRQIRLKDLGERLAARLIRHYRTRPVAQRPDVWFTYHMYHKAPDWLGPRVCEALDIPYIVAEASYAPKHADGPWNINHKSVAAAIARADLLIGFNPDDAPCLRPFVKPSAHDITLRPFLDTEAYRHVMENKLSHRHKLAKQHGLDENSPWLLCVAMMRDDQKRRSYEVLAHALDKIKTRPWRLLVVGNGPAEPHIKATFAPLGARVCWLGLQGDDDLRALYGASDLFVWPAIKEAYGMVFLEALAAGLPVVAGHSAGVAAVVSHEHTGLLTPQGDVEAFAKALARLLDDAPLRAQMATRAPKDMAENHSLKYMAPTLDRLLQTLMMEPER